MHHEDLTCTAFLPHPQGGGRDPGRTVVLLRPRMHVERARARWPSFYRMRACVHTCARALPAPPPPPLCCARACRQCHLTVTRGRGRTRRRGGDVPMSTAVTAPVTESVREWATLVVGTGARTKEVAVREERRGGGRWGRAPRVRKVWWWYTIMGGAVGSRYICWEKNRHVGWVVVEVVKESSSKRIFVFFVCALPPPPP